MDPEALVAAGSTSLADLAEAARLVIPGIVGDDQVREGLVSGFLLIFFSEIGDKTFFIALLLALKNSRSAVFTGTFGALAIMTVISVFLGQALHTIDELVPADGSGPLPRLPYDDILAAALLIWFGIQTLKVRAAACTCLRCRGWAPQLRAWGTVQGPWVGGSAVQLTARLRPEAEPLGCLFPCLLQGAADAAADQEEEAEEAKEVVDSMASGKKDRGLSTAAGYRGRKQDTEGPCASLALLVSALCCAAMRAHSSLFWGSQLSPAVSSNYQQLACSR